MGESTHGVDTDNGSSALAVVDRLATRLADVGVRYCHWKSNEALGLSLTGENDLDLLVARRDARSFRNVLDELGFVQVRPPRARQVLGLEDHLLRDGATGRIVHVQPHFELIVGDDMTKSFRLPIEDAFLESAGGAPIPVPAPEMEYLVFLIRMTVKHCPLEALIARKGRLTVTERRELSWLEERIDLDLVETRRRELFPHLEADLWTAMRFAIESDAGLVTRARVGRRLLRCLRADARRSLVTDLMLKIGRRLATRIRRRPRGKTLATAGLFVAVVGGDGSGKSSLVDAVVEEMSSLVAVHRVHLGKPPRGLLNRAVTRPLRFLRRRGAFDATRQPPWVEFATHPGFVFSIWHCLIARDRYRAYVRARRMSGRGHLVVSDRFPLVGISSMDGPRLAGLPDLERRLLLRTLARREAWYYRRIRPPDLLVVLRVPPEVAAERRQEQGDGFVMRRALEVWDADWEGTGAVVLDASAPHAAVIDAGLSEIWRRM